MNRPFFPFDLYFAFFPGASSPYTQVTLDQAGTGLILGDAAAAGNAATQQQQQQQQQQMNMFSDMGKQSGIHLKMVCM